MLPEIGHYSLIIAFCLSLTQAILPLWGSYIRKASYMQLASSTAYGQLFFIGLSMGILAYSLLSNDFSIAYVAQNSNTHLPVIYRFCATWGAHEGSLLLWVFMLSIWSALVSYFTQTIPLVMRARVLSILGMVSMGFLFFLLATSNPFQRILPDVPLQGRDLNPLLQDPGLAVHPPILYLGYVGFSVVFAFALAALLSERWDASWARFARPWTLVAWSFLTLGITLGSWWAYRVLGWGGWWFWDPVENASFLPWLSGTALIHSLIVSERRNTFKAWTVFLAVCTFSLSLLGTFLVRSGILVSVHAFALDPTRGNFMLYFLAIVIGGSFALYAWKGHTLKNSGIFKLWSRETMLLTNNVLLVTCTVTVLLGTLYPLIIDAMGLGKLSVGPPYFNTVFIPLMTPILFLMGIGPALHWREAKLALIVNRFRITFPLCICLAIVLPFLFTGQLQLWVVVGLLLAFWVIFATIQNNFITYSEANKSSAKNKITLRKFSFHRLGMVLAHIGFAICAIGIIASSAYSVERDVRMQPNDILAIGPYLVQFNHVTTEEGSNYSAYKGQFKIKNHREWTLLEPELRIFNTQKMALAKTAIKARPFHDLYIALGEQLERGAWSLRIYYKPFVRWIWLGGILMMIGGLFAAIKSKRNVETV